MTPLEVAQTFAKALDHDDYAAAAEVIHPACVYSIQGRTIRGRDDIIASYRNASEKGNAVFDSLQFDSHVSMDGDRAIIAFLDILIHAGQRHEHRCEQHLTIEGGQVIAIEHIDLPGEPEALAAFKHAVGLG